MKDLIKQLEDEYNFPMESLKKPIENLVNAYKVNSLGDMVKCEEDINKHIKNKSISNEICNFIKGYTRGSTSFSLNSERYSIFIKTLALKEISRVTVDNSEIDTAIGLVLHKVERSVIDTIAKEYVKNVSYINSLKILSCLNNLYDANYNTFITLMDNSKAEIIKQLDKSKDVTNSPLKEELDMINDIVANFKKGHTF